MPLFEYRCRTCAHQFEALVRSHDPAPACRACGSEDLERLTSPFAVTSAEQRKASADKAVRQASAVGREETAARDREADAHRHEEHG